MGRGNGWRAKRVELRRAARIDAAPARVYAAIADVSTRPSWMPELQSIDPPRSRPVRPGDRFTGESRLLLHQFLGESTVVVADEPEHLEEEVVIGARFRTTWKIEPDGQGAVVIYDIKLDYPGGPLGRLERWVLRRRLNSMQRRSLDRIAAQLGSAAGGRT